MDELFKQLVSSVEVLRNGTGVELTKSLDLIIKVLNLKLPIPHNYLSLVLLRVCGVAKSNSTNIKCFEALNLIISSDFFKCLIDTTEEAKKNLIILLSALIYNICRDHSEIKKQSWLILKKCVKVADEDIIKSCFPGITAAVIEEIKKFRCQGVGSNHSNTVCAVKCCKRLLSTLIEAKNTEWQAMALSKSSSAINIIISELLQISEILQDKPSLLKLLQLLPQLTEYKKPEILSLIIELCALLKKEIPCEIPHTTFQQIFLKNLMSLKDPQETSKKTSRFNTMVYCLNCFQNDSSAFLANYKASITESILFVSRLDLSLDYSGFKMITAIPYVEGDESCWASLKEFLKAVVKFEIFDSFLTDQQSLLTKLRKGQLEAEVMRLLQIVVVFSQVYLEASAYIMSELIFSELQEIKLQVFCKFILIEITRKQLESEALSTLEVIENALFCHCKETETICKELLEELSVVTGEDSVKSLIDSYTSSLQNSLTFKLSAFGLKSIQSSILRFIALKSSDLLTIEYFLTECTKTYDISYHNSDKNSLEIHLKFFHCIIEVLKSSNTNIKRGNVIRIMLLRTRPLLSLKPSNFENRKLVLLALQLFKESLSLLDNVPFEIDHSDISAFAFEEEENVSIPNGMAEIAYEFLQALVGCLKVMADSNCFGIAVALVEVLCEVNRLDPEFFETEHRFARKFWPFFKVILRGQTPNQQKLNEKVVGMIEGFSQRTIFEVRNEIADAKRVYSGKATKLIE